MRHSESGLTLFELMLAITIVGILLGVAVPSFTTAMRNSQQIAVANELLSSMHFAREMAIRRNARVTMCPSSSGTNCQAVTWDQGWLVFVDTDGDGTVDGDEPVELVAGLSGLESITTAEFGNAIIYRPNGRAMGATVATNIGQMVLCDQRGAEHARVAIIGMSGRPRIDRVLMDGSAPACP
ncbi:MAG TPA: GspH/FimT family pseudopilin [Gammaproteobacteria bacterium]|nr:GspH/FimT family pseudopilin [Gammaproteobacteria bacterium]